MSSGVFRVSSGVFRVPSATAGATSGCHRFRGPSQRRCRICLFDYINERRYIVGGCARLEQLVVLDKVEPAAEAGQWLGGPAFAAGLEISCIM